MRRLLAAAFGLAFTVVSAAADGGGAEAQKARAAALEAIVAAKQVAIQAAWKDLAALEAEASKLRESGPTPPAEQTEARAAALLLQSERRASVEARRTALLRQLASSYAELEAARGLLEESRGKLRQSHQVLEGLWTLTMMPSGLRGELLLDQKGTLVSGEYTLENGMHGNVQGTLIGGQLVLERIDAQLGRIGRFEAALAKDESSLRGTWYSYELASGKPLVGALVIERPPAEEEPAP